MTQGSQPVAALEGFIAASRKQAVRRGQQPTTAHCVLEMLQHDADASAALHAAGVLEAQLVSALKVVEPEASYVLTRASERANQLVRRYDGSVRPIVRPAHLLLAITMEPHSAAVQCFERLGVSNSRVQAALVARLGGGDAPRPGASHGASASVSAPSSSTASPRLRTTGLPRPHRAGVQLALPSPRAAEPRKNRRVSEVSEARSASPERPSGPPAKGEAASKDEAAPGKETGSRWELDRERFPLLSSVGRNLSALAAQGKIDPVFGREAELERMLDILARRRGNNPLLVGPPGVGKTAIAEALALAIVQAREEPTREGLALGPLADRIVIEVTPGALASGTGVRGAVAGKLKKLEEELARAEGRVLLFLDEIHAIVGEPAGPDDLATELKGSLARGEITCIGASTEAEFKKHFDRDPAFARRFSLVHVSPPSAALTERILEGLLPRYEAHHEVRYEPSAVRAAVEMTVRFLPERHLPDKAIGVLDLVGARAHRLGLHEVSAADVARVVAEQAHVPVDRLLGQDSERLLALEARLEERVVGQARALARIADTLRKGAAGFRGRRPLGTFLLLGPTGVGKTETAKAIADALFAPGAMSRFDMSELSEAHSVARLIGAPPGYVGHDAGGQLTEAVRRRPYQLVLLDEIEKAHPEVLLALLPLLDEGRLTDGLGRTVDFTNTVIVMTSNLGASAATARAHRSIGFGALADTSPTVKEAEEREARVMDAARRSLPPELWNRIDEPLYFGPLEHADVVEIARRMLQSVAATLRAERGVELEIDGSACEALALAGGFDASLGARPMRRTIGRLVESPLASRLLSSELERGGRVRLVGRGERVVFEPSEPSDQGESLDAALSFASA